MLGKRCAQGCVYICECAFLSACRQDMKHRQMVLALLESNTRIKLDLAGLPQPK